nr:MAG TPA: hypothetical protein [Caudoviricetes sp.]
MYFATIRNIVAESSRFEMVPSFFYQNKTHTNKLIFFRKELNS